MLIKLIVMLININAEILMRQERIAENICPNFHDLFLKTINDKLILSYIVWHFCDTRFYIISINIILGGSL